MRVIFTRLLVLVLLFCNSAFATEVCIMNDFKQALAKLQPQLIGSSIISVNGSDSVYFSGPVDNSALPLDT